MIIIEDGIQLINMAVVTFTANEYNSSYTTFSEPIKLRASGVSYFNGGNVGIGTTSPANNLVVYNGSGWAGADLNGTSGGELIFRTSGTLKANIYASTSTGFVLNGASETIFQIGSSEKMRIINDGNVGIGTSSPSAKLHVSGGDILLTGDLTGNDGTRGYKLGKDTAEGGRSYLVLDNDTTDGIGSGTDYLLISKYGAHATVYNTDTGSLFLQTSGATTTMLANGNIGIGTTSPNAKLVIDSSEPRFRLNISGTNHIILNHDGSTAILRTESNTPFTFGTNGTEKMRIAAGGNVGIGTSNPISLLQIAGTTSMFPTYDSVTGYSYFLRMGYDTSGSYDYTIKRNGTTGFLEFNGTQGSPYVSYVFAGGDVYSGASGGTVRRILF